MNRREALFGMATLMALGSAFGRHVWALEGKEKGMTTGKITIYDVRAGTLKEVDRIVRSDEEWRSILTPDQFRITRRKGTERAFTGEYNDNKEKGIYQCVACDTDLFSSEDKFDSGTGWPSYTRPVSEHNIKTAEDRSFFTVRTEVLCARCDAHQGHVFADGPPPTGLRYCINSAALKFVKAEK